MVMMMVVVQMYAKNSMARRLQCGKPEQEGNRERDGWMWILGVGACMSLLVVFHRAGELDSEPCVRGDQKGQ